MFKKIVRFSIRKKLFVALTTLFLMIGGIYSMLTLPIDAVPDITNNQVQIVTVSPTLAPQEVEQLITFPIEVAMSNIMNVQEIRSVSRFGLSLVTVVFKESVPTLDARQLVNEQIQTVAGEIPSELGVPEMMPITTGLGEIYQYVLKVAPGYEKKYDAMELRTIQDWIVKRQLSGIPGIVEINSFGGYLKQYEVASQILHSRLGIRRSRRIQALYEEILKMDHNLEKATLEDVCSNIKEPELSGVFLCEYTVFREIYRLETRRASRGKIPEYLLLLTLEFHELEQVMEAARFLYHKKKAMEKLKTILMDQLRMGDVVARYSDEQYIVMLPWCTLEGVYKVINRIRGSYMKEINCVRVEIRAEMREVTADYDLPVRIQRKAGWENDSV